MNKVHVPDLPAPLWTAAELTGVTGGYWVHEPPAAWLPTGLTFTRRPKFMRPGDIYVTMDSATYNRADALKDDPAKAWDTAAQLPMLMAAGISAIIAQRDIPSAPARLPLLRVADSRRAVLDLARAARARFDGRAIAVTGTAGKSTTKEMLRHVLAQQGPTFATMANFNTRFGVPLSVAQTPRDARYAIY
jgi:UDP-N-acetylmuramoyl-tripeptide--D-alanyl-D-alanine ligase